MKSRVEFSWRYSVPEQIKGGKRILYVEPDVAWVNIVKQAFIDEPRVTFTIASNSAEFQELFRQKNYDAVITEVNLDSKMPQRAHGLEIARIVKKEKPEIPVILLSTALTGDVIHRAAKIGVDGVILKQGIGGTESLRALIQDKLRLLFFK